MYLVCISERLLGKVEGLSGSFSLCFVKESIPVRRRMGRDVLLGMRTCGRCNLLRRSVFPPECGWKCQLVLVSNKMDSIGSTKKKKKEIVGN